MPVRVGILAMQFKAESIRDSVLDHGTPARHVAEKLGHVDSDETKRAATTDARVPLASPLEKHSLYE
jgi:hypothetical protein